MRLLKIYFLLFSLLFFVGCSSTTNEEETGDQFSSEVEAQSADSSESDLDASESEDLADADELDSEETAAAEPPADDTNEEDLTKEEFVESGAESDVTSDSAPMPDANTSDMNMAEAPPAPEVADESSASGYEQEVVVTGIDFKSNENGGTIVIQTSGPAQYTIKENQKNNQYVVEVKNARLPERFKKPFNTKEFSGPVGMFQAYQPQGSLDAKIVVQLKNSTAMSVVQEGNSLLIMPGRADAVVANEPAVGEDGSVQSVKASEPSEEPVDDDKALSSKTLDEFLTGDAQFYGRKIDIEVKNGDIRDVLNLISEESGLNLVISPAVKGVVNLKLRRIPWDQALVIMLQSNQLGYVRQGNILRVATLAEIRAESEEAKRLLDSQKQLEPLKVRIFNVSYAKADEMSGQVTNFLSARGKVKSDTRTNSLVVTDINEVLVKVDKLIKRLDTQTPQVLIEAKIIEAREDLDNRFGISWSAKGDATLTQNLITGHIDRLATAGLTAALQLLSTENKVKILSAPRVVTLNNVAATIDQTEQRPLFSSTTNPTTGQITSTVTFKPLKLSLSVTPQITAVGGVIMKMELAREFPGAVVTTNDTGAFPVFSRNASSTVLVQSGDTTVIGGIYSTDKSEGHGGIPILRKIPLLGGLFGSNTYTENKNELLIFITPKILNKEKAFGESAGTDNKEQI